MLIDSTALLIIADIDNIIGLLFLNLFVVADPRGAEFIAKKEQF